MAKAKEQTKTTENRPVTSGDLPQGRAIKNGCSHGVGEISDEFNL